MIDTASINFGISKLSNAFTTIQPKLSELTDSFVKYKVTEQLTVNIMMFVLIPIVLLLYIPVHKYGKNKGHTYNNFDEPGYAVPTILLGIALVTFIGFAILMLPDSILAIKYPEMFAIQSMLPSTCR